MTQNSEENKDFGFHSRQTSNCSKCQEKRTLDDNCGAVRCGGIKDPVPSNSDLSSGSLWWRKGACLEDY